MDAYWINLDDQRDCASQCITQLSKIGVTENRVSNVTRSEVGIVENMKNQHYFLGIIACRMSHMRTLNAFLSSTHDCGLILEDDFFSQKK
jgi:GR25 family glycosyltransferase involved in LPS biosynthesis